MRYTTYFFVSLLIFGLAGGVSACQQATAVPELGLVTLTPIPVPELLGLAAVPTVTPSPPADIPPTQTPPPTADLNMQPTLGPRSTKAPPTPTTALFPTETPFVPTATASPYIQPTYAPDNPIYDGLDINSLTARIYGAGSFSITETLSDEGSYMRYQFSYLSDGREVDGFLNVPHEGENFPVVMVLHGYVNPSEYELLAYTTRYADDLAEAGYMVFHPSYRGHPIDKENRLDEDELIFRIAYAVDALNLLSHIENGSQDPTGPLRRADADNIHLFGHSMGGGIAQRMMTVRPDSFRAAVLYGSMSGDESRNYKKIRQWGGERRWEKEVYAPPEIIQAVSPIYYLDRWRTPVSIHHGTADGLVPVAWSRELCEALKNISHPVECFDYVNRPHTFYGGSEELFMERVITFFKRY